MPLLAKIEQAPGRGDENVDACFQRLHLVMLVDAAEDHGRAQGELAPISAEALGDLAGELAGRREDERARRAGKARLAGRVGGKTLQDRQSEGRGLAGARFGNAEQVLAGGKERNGSRLDRRRPQVVFGLERKPQGLDQAEAVESR